MKTVVVGMSGGVDSSVTALLLKEQGYKVIGLFMKNWEEEDVDGHCMAEKDFEDVAKVCEVLDIPYYGINFVKEYETRVFDDFLRDLKSGLTPNPDILCNREIKFDLFLKKAMALGADYLATGHYCQTDGTHLLRGSDPNKDQSYFLHKIDGKALKKVLFPIGQLPKPEVREIAKKHNLPVFDKRDSTGICFIGKRPFKSFVQNYLKPKPGPIITLDGATIGTHDGAQFYTIGQRKGLGVGGPGEPYFVAKKDIESNTITLVQGENHPALFSKALHAKDVSWIAEPPLFPYRCTAKVRYRSPDTPCLIEQTADGLRVTFDTPERAVTPGQSVVFYNENTCLGGGIIANLTH